VPELLLFDNRGEAGSWAAADNLEEGGRMAGRKVVGGVTGGDQQWPDAAGEQLGEYAVQAVWKAPVHRREGVVEVESGKPQRGLLRQTGRPVPATGNATEARWHPAISDH